MVHPSFQLSAHISCKQFIKISLVLSRPKWCNPLSQGCTTGSPVPRLAIAFILQLCFNKKTHSINAKITRFFYIRKRITETLI